MLKNFRKIVNVSTEPEDKKSNIFAWLINVHDPLPFQLAHRRAMRSNFLVENLTKRGHKVLWWTSAFDHSSKDWRFKGDTFRRWNEDLNIIALKGCSYKRNFSLRRFLINYKLLSKKFRRIAPSLSPPDVIVAHTPPYELAYEAVRYAHQRGIPVIVDIRDQWPDAFFLVIPPFLHPLTRLLLRRDYQMLRYALKHATAIFSMMEGLLEWGLKKGERRRSPYDRVFHLGAPKMGEGRAPEGLEVLAQELKKKGTFVVTYIGTFVSGNDPSLIIEAGRSLQDLNIHFIMGGDGPLLPLLKKKSEGLKNITFTGWLTPEEMEYVLSLSHVGVALCSFPKKAFPNKVFSYLSAGLPILASFEGELKEIIEKHRIGFHFPPNDLERFVEHIDKLYGNPALYQEMSQNAKAVFEDLFRADKIYSEYASFVEEIAQVGRKG